MLGKAKLTQGDRLDAVCEELLQAVKVSEDEIAATATSSDLYEGLRLRIADIGARSSRRTSVYERLLGFYTTLVESPRSLALVTAAAILLLLAASAFVLLPGASSPEQRAGTQPVAQTSPPQNAIQADRRDNTESIKPASVSPRRISHRRRHADSRSTEVATDFLPLTFVDDSRAQQSGHVVRVKVLRSALIAFGVPMNMERAGELITADVVVGEDGLARAIRFVQ
jgi:hypothetical protein